jgi:hypothetical protein
VSDHRRIRTDFDLPELSKAQAHALWCFFEDLASDIWDTYQLEVLDETNLDQSRVRETEDCISGHYDCDSSDDDQNPNNDDSHPQTHNPDPDF